MKVCNACGIEKEPRDFYKNKSSKDGLTGDCKECRKKRALEREKRLREENPDFAEKERIRARERYHRLYRGKARNPKTVYKRAKVYSNRFPEKKAAHQAVARAKKKSKRRFPEGVQMHHFSYHPDHWLQVFLLTKMEHIEIHRHLEYDEEVWAFYPKTSSDWEVLNASMHKRYIEKILGRRVEFIDLGDV